MTAEEYRCKGIDLANEDKLVEALEYFNKAIQRGSEIAINDAAVVYERSGLTKKAFEYYKRACEHNIPMAYQNIANFYNDGWLGTVDIREAVKCYETAGRLGVSEAYIKLFDIYIKGKGEIKKDVPKAIEYLKKGAEIELQEPNSKNYGCIMDLSFFYINGKHIEKDEKKAYELLKKAERKNSGALLYNLGTCYLEGLGTNKNIDEAINILRRSVELSYPSSCYSLGKLYLEGKDVKKDMLKAYYYLRKGIDCSSIKCALLFAETCLKQEENVVDFNMIHAKTSLWFIYITFLNEPLEKYQEERGEYIVLRNKYKDSVDFEKLERDVLLTYNKKVQPNIIA